MRLDRLLLASAACALVAGAAVAQTTTTTSSTRSTSAQTGAQAGATPGAYAQPGSTTGAYAQPGAAGATSTSTTTTGAGTNAGGQMSGQTPGATGMGTAGQAGGSMSSGLATGGAFQPITPTAGANIVATLQASGQFTTFLKAVTATNLTSVLQQPGNLTVFAPTDAAFAALPAGQLATLMQPANAAQLQQFVLLHVVNTPIRSAELLNHAFINVPTVATGKSIHLDGSTGTLKVDGNAVLQSDVRASNGSIFVIGQALSPSYVAPTTSEAANVPAAAEPAAATETKSTTTTTKSTAAKKRKK